MGINFILPLIAGIVMTVILGTQVAPSLVENMKIAKVENRTIANQNLIKDAIVRYIKMEKKVPKDLEELKTYGILKDYHESNIFGGGYSFDINKEKGTLKIFTTINDNGAGKYFSNSFKFPNKPTCVEVNGACTGTFETFYLLDEETFETFKSMPPEVGSKEDILDRFSEENLGNKKDKDGEEIVFGVFDKDNFLKDNEDGTFTIIEKEKQPDGTWSNTGKETIISGNNIGKETNVFISDLEWRFIDGLGEEIKQKHEKVHCKGIEENLIGEEGFEVFVVNENTKLGELVWVAPNNVSKIKTKIFGKGFTPNNICTSNVVSMRQLFYNQEYFNLPLDRWDVSNVTNMSWMFYAANNFNQSLNDWDVSNVTDMSYMLRFATNFNKALNDWDVSNVTTMSKMFANMKEFNLALNNWDVSNVIDMDGMFYGASNFNQPLDKWNVSQVKTMAEMFGNAKAFNEALNDWSVSNVTSMGGMFYGAEVFNQPINDWDVSKVIKMNGMFKSATNFDQPLDKWDVSSVTNMVGMFDNAIAFNQALSKWCVFEIKTKPNNFDYVANSWTEPNKPIWGTCPNS